MFKNAVIAILAPILVFSALNVLAGEATLPNYEKEAKLAIEVSCDANSVTGKQYFAEGRYTVIVIEAASESYYLVANTDDVFFFLKRGDVLVEMEHDAWDETLLKNAPNAFMAIHDLPNDCIEKNT